MLLIEIGFVLLTLVYVAQFIRVFKQGLAITNWPAEQKKKILHRLYWALLAWALFASFWSMGMMEKFELFPLNVAPILIIPLISIAWFSFSKSTGAILDIIPPQKIIQLQSFRFFVELLLWALFIESVLPVQMTFEGMNFDVLSGLTAPIVAFLLARTKINKSVLVIWNIACLALLVNIVTIAILSMPTPFRYFMNEPTNTVVAHFPFSWLPAFLVPLAYGLHFLSLRQLFRMK